MIFSWKCIFKTVQKLFLAIFEMVKNLIWPKKLFVTLIYLISGVFFGRDFFKFSSPLCFWRFRKFEIRYFFRFGLNITTSKFWLVLPSIICCTCIWNLRLDYETIFLKLEITLSTVQVTVCSNIWKKWNLEPVALIIIPQSRNLTVFEFFI